MLKRIALFGALAAALALTPLGVSAYTSNTSGTTINGVLEALTDIVTAVQSAPAAGVSLADASISSATGASQTVAPASAPRKALIIANPAATTWWINPTGGTASANCGGCFELPPGSYWSPKPAPTNAVTGIGTAASKLTVAGG
jgi:hypothetical protein